MTAHARPTDPAAIAVERLSVRQGDRAVVDDVSFEVAPGEVVGLVGKRHAGTSAVLRALVGLLPSTGRIRILGRPYARLADPGSTVGAFLGPDGHPGMRVRDHVGIAAAQHGAPEDRIDRVLADAGLADDARSRLRQLPASARQRLGIAMTLLGDPRVVLLDDPATGLDPAGEGWLRELVKRLSADGAAVLLACHPLSVVAADLDRAVAMAEGRVVVDASPEEIQARAGSEVVARTPAADALAGRLRELGAEGVSASGDEVRAERVSPAAVTRVAAGEQIPVLEAREDVPTLEQAIETVADEASDAGADDGETVADEASDDGAADGGTAADGDVADGSAHAETSDVEAAGGGTTSSDAAADADADTTSGPAEEGPGVAAGGLEAALDRELADLPADRSRVVAFTSPARGGGTTTLVALAADALAATTGGRTVAVGLSGDPGSVDRMAPRSGRSRLDIGDLVHDLADFEDGGAELAPYAAASPAGALLLRGPEDRTALARIDADAVGRLLAVLTWDHAHVLLDVGVGLPPDAVALIAERADAVVLVGNPDAADALTAPSPVVDVVERVRTEPAVLAMNRTAPEQARAFAREQAPDRAVVPDDPAALDAVDRGTYALADADETTRVALKHLAAVVAGAAAVPAEERR